MIKKILWVLLSLLLVLVLVLSSCGPTEVEEEEEVVLNVGVGMADASMLDPHTSSPTQDAILFGWMFNGLVRFKPGSMDPASVEPDLAERWESSSDGLTWTFYLREGVKFHGDYGELKAEDIAFSLNRAGNPETSAWSSDYVEFESVTALDSYTVQIKLANTVPSLLILVANYHGGFMISKKAAEEMGEDFRLHPIGTGPFAFSDYKSKQYVALVAHKDYFRGAPQIDKIIYRYLPEDAPRELAFIRGEIDLMHGVRLSEWIERMREEGHIVDVFGPGELRTMHFNMTQEPLGNILVRKAMAHAISRDEIISFFGESVTAPCYTVVPNGYLGHTDDVVRYEYDPEKAKTLLTEAGHPDGFTIKAIITQRPALRVPMEIIQEQLRRVGITLELEVVEHASFHSMIREDLSPLVFYGCARVPIADIYLTQFYHSQSIVATPTAVANFSHVDVADAEIDAARREPDPKKQLEYWKVAQQKIMAECVSYPFYELLQVWARSDKLDYGFELEGCLTLGPLLNETCRLTK